VGARVGERLVARRGDVHLPARFLEIVGDQPGDVLVVFRYEDVHPRAIIPRRCYATPKRRLKSS
jgi:hypothetical protein